MDTLFVSDDTDGRWTTSRDAFSASLNSTTKQASGMEANDVFSLSLRFSPFVGNSHANFLGFVTLSNPSTLNNSCESAGVICREPPFTIALSVVQLNTIEARRAPLTFVECVSDHRVIKSGSISVVTTMCGLDLSINLVTASVVGHSQTGDLPVGSRRNDGVQDCAGCGDVLAAEQRPPRPPGADRRGPVNLHFLPRWPTVSLKEVSRDVAFLFPGEATSCLRLEAMVLNHSRSPSSERFNTPPKYCTPDPVSIRGGTEDNLHFARFPLALHV
jgi:hypothetical protein